MAKKNNSKIQKKEHDDSNLEKAVAMTAAILSVLLAISSIFGGQAGGDATKNLVQSTDQWAFYQAKSIKGNLYEADKAMLQTQRNNTANTPEYNIALDKQIADFDTKITKYNTEKADIQKNAQDLEKASQSADEKSNMYDYANGFYQIAIILAAIAILIKKRYMLYGSIALGLIGTGIAVYAFMMV